MSAPHAKGPVTRQDLNIGVGPYDELHHPHGYRWKPEPHHWYWFVGVAAGIVAALSVPLIYFATKGAAAPFCSKSVEVLKPSPNGLYVVEVATVSCMGGTPEKWIMIGTEEAKTRSIASYDNKASIYIRWKSDTDLRFTETGGKLYYITPAWKDVRIRHE